MNSDNVRDERKIKDEKKKKVLKKWHEPCRSGNHTQIVFITFPKPAQQTFTSSY
jgi:hypothetical protein